MYGGAPLSCDTGSEGCGARFDEASTGRSGFPYTAGNAGAMSTGIERGQWKDLWEVSVTSEKKTGSSFRWEATIKPDGDPEKTEVRWYRWDREEEQWQFYEYNGPSRDELSEEAKETLGRVYGFIFRKVYEKERRESIERNADPEE